MKIPKLEVGSRILVMWDDAHVLHDAYWATLDEVAPIEPIQTLGHYIHHNDRFLTVAQSWGAGNADQLDGFGGAFSIPLGTIQSITILKGN